MKSVHRTPENIAACLHPHVGADSQLASVQQALAQLEAAHLVRKGDDGYRIPTPAEDDWERVRSGRTPSPATRNRIYQEIIQSLWEPQPSHSLLGIKPFKGGLAFKGRLLLEGDITFQVHLADDPAQLDALATELRARSRDERSDIFWAAALNDAIDQAVVELLPLPHGHRRSRSARPGPRRRPALVAEERRRRDGHQADLRKRMAQALLGRQRLLPRQRSQPERRRRGRRQGRQRHPGRGHAADLRALRRGRGQDRGRQAGPGRPAQGGEPARACRRCSRALGLLRDEHGKTVFAVEPASVERGPGAHREPPTRYGQVGQRQGPRGPASPRSRSAGTSRWSGCSRCACSAPESIAVTSKGQTHRGRRPARTSRRRSRTTSSSGRHRSGRGRSWTSRPAWTPASDPDDLRASMSPELSQCRAGPPAPPGGGPRDRPGQRGAVPAEHRTALPGRRPPGAAWTRCASIGRGVGGERDRDVQLRPPLHPRRASSGRRSWRTALTQPRLVDIGRARQRPRDPVAGAAGRAGRAEATCARTPRQLADLLARETFFKRAAGDRPGHQPALRGVRPAPQCRPLGPGQPPTSRPSMT